MNSITYFIKHSGECSHNQHRPLCWCHTQRLAYSPEVPRDITGHLTRCGLTHIGEVAGFPIWQGSLEHCMDALAGLPGWAVGGLLVSFRIHSRNPREDEWIRCYLDDCWIRVIQQQPKGGIAMADLGGFRHALRVTPHRATVRLL